MKEKLSFWAFRDYWSFAAVIKSAASAASLGTQKNPEKIVKKLMKNCIVLLFI